jgi:hypothetical protein
MMKFQSEVATKVKFEPKCFVEFVAERRWASLSVEAPCLGAMYPDSTFEDYLVAY